ncbi:MAG: thiamine ABC transporter substrate binding subunit [Acidimicrobiia bacterium]
MNIRRAIHVAVVSTLIAASCSGDGEGAPPDEIVLATHDSFAISPDVLAGFEQETGVAIRLLEAGDAGTLVSNAILTKDNPTADVLFGIDNTFLSRALDEDLFLPYTSPLLSEVRADLVLDDEHRVTPIDFANVCLNYDKAGLTAAGLTPPATLRDLASPSYRGTLVVQDPATSSPGLAFLLSTIAEFPEGSDYPWQQYWADLAANDVLVTSGWEQAYFGDFSGGSEDGDRSIVVSYASSPPAAVFFSEGALTEAPTAAVLDGCFRQIEFAGVLAGTEAEATAQALIDYMLGLRFQEDIPLNMFVFPANALAALPDVFVEHTAVPETPNALDPLLIEANRNAWIETWTEIVR